MYISRGYRKFRIRPRQRTGLVMVIVKENEKLRRIDCGCAFWPDFVRCMSNGDVAMIDATNDKPNLSYLPDPWSYLTKEESIVAEIYERTKPITTGMGVFYDASWFFIKCYKPNYEEKLWKYLENFK